MNRIKEIFVPTSIDTVDGLIGFLIQAVEQHGGDPSTIKVVDTDIAIPNVEFSDEWPRWTLNFDLKETQ